MYHMYVSLENMLCRKFQKRVSKFWDEIATAILETGE